MKQKEVKIGSKKYKLQKIPFKFFVELNDKHTNKHGNLMRAPYIEDLFKYCVIEPKVKMSDFDDDMASGMELSREIESFLTTKSDEEASPEESPE